MNSTALLLVLFAQSPDSQAIADLFDALDSNGDGKVLAAEISDSQRPYFQRALRVSDRNEDGALTRDELTTALSDPQPVAVTAPDRGNFDPAMLDRNKDGYISKDEVPAPLQERFKQAFQQSGDRISVEMLQRMRGGQPSARSTDSKSKPMSKSETMAMNEDATRMAGFIKRLDTDQDGNLSAKELKNAPARIRVFDRNRDGTLSKAELSAIMRSPAIQGDDKRMDRSGTKPRGNSAPRPTAANADQFFERLDQNDDGKLTGSEIPQRMRQVLQRVDRDNDKSVSREEFRRAVERQQRGDQ